MKKRMIWIILTLVVALAAVVPMRGAVAGLMSRSQAAAAPQQMERIPDMSTLLNYPYPVMVEDLEEPERTLVLNMLMAREETIALIAEMQQII
jgi:flagellar basal body-associated protein FliL